MVECRTRAKKDGGKYTICYNEKSKAKPKPKPKLKVIEAPKPKSKPKLKVVEAEKPKAKRKPKLKVIEAPVSEKAKKIIAAGKTTNRLDDLPDVLKDKIMQMKEEEEGKQIAFEKGSWFNAGKHWKYGAGPNLQILKGGSKKGDVVEFRIIGKGKRIYKRSIAQAGGHLRGKALAENAKTEPLYIRIPQDRFVVPGTTMRMDTEKEIYAEDLQRR
jgi:hypothetical protein